MVCSMDRWVGKVAIVTGASAGIGAGIAQRLTEEGLVVVGFARRKERIEELSKQLSSCAKGKLYGMRVDITKEDEIIEAFKWIEANLGPVHILVNNAGVVRETNLMDGNTQYWRDVFETNVIGLSIATREAIRSMKRNNVDGHIIHMNSVSGHYIPPVRDFNMYPPSKHAVTALTEMLRRELIDSGSKIKVTSVSPGATVSEVMETNNVKGALRQDFENNNKLVPEDIADAIVYILSTPPHVQVHELMLRSIAQKA